MISDVERTHKNIKRAGNKFLYDIFSQYRCCHSILHAEDALKIFNTLGLSLSTIILIANSHFLNVDEQKFLELLENQNEQHKNRRPC